MIVKGQRVMTPLGPATVEAFEIFDDAGHSQPTTEIDNGGRVVVKLDEPENWLLHKADSRYPNPYMFRSQLSDLGE